ncbi:TPA: hypothetical protein JLK82_003602 [Escherichia coli]|nr:hypothetical protein [Escherichia coli]HAW1020315.1 hypothetical protein [Escherichia coli]
MSEYRELEKIVSLLQQRVENLSAVITQINTQFIPKIHDRLAASERHVKKFNRMLALWECGELVEQKVVEKIVKVPVASDEDLPQKKRSRKEVDYEMYQQVKQFTNEGLGIQRIGKLLGISKQTVSNIRAMPLERVERLKQLYERGESPVSGRAVIPLKQDELQQILNVQKRVPNISVSRLSALTGLSAYRVQKYLALTGAERKALLSAVTDATPVVNTASDVTVTQSRMRKSRKGDDLNDPVFFSDDSDM